MSSRELENSTSSLKKSRADLARSAFEEKDAEQSRQAHEFRLHSSETHKNSGKYIKSVVFGGLDGIITTFATVSSIAGAKLQIGVIIVIGIATLIADALSMGVGDFISSTAEREFQTMEKRREEWECENYLEGEKNEMIELYVKKGLSEEDATTVVEVMSRNKAAFVDIMMVEELGIMPPDVDDAPWKDGIVTFISFCVFGCVPLIAYVIWIAAFGAGSAGLDGTFAFSAILTAITLFVLGALTSKVTVQPWWKAGLKTLVLGTITSVVAFLIGYALSFVASVD